MTRILNVLTFLVLAFLLVKPSERATAQGGATTYDVTTAFAYESVTVGTSAVGFTGYTVTESNTTFPASQAYCSIETEPIRFRYDGTDPTSSEGHPAAAGSEFRIYGSTNIRRFRAISSSGSNSNLRCTFSR